MILFSISFAVIFLCLVGLLGLLNQLPILLFALYAGLSVVTFLMYWKDKNAARKDTRRTPENTLHLLAALGGWPGALIGQQKLRHKSQKVSFIVVLWLTVLLNISALIGIYYVMRQAH